MWRDVLVEQVLKRRRRRRGRPRAELFELAAKRGSEYLSTTVDGVVYVVATSDQGMSRDLFVWQRRPEFVVLERVITVIGRPPEGSQLVDVGANIGTSVLPALVSYGFADAVACEPGPQAARVLRLSRAANDLVSRLQVVEAAITDQEVAVQLRIQGGPGTFEVATRERQGDLLVSVPARTLDGLVDEGVIEPERLGLLWVDAQGHEGHVLAGARKLLEADAPLAISLRFKKLRRSDGLNAFVELCERHFARVVDLRAPGLRVPHWEPHIEGIEALRRYLAENRKTDVLLLRR